MQNARDHGWLEATLREEVETRPVVAYRLLELVARGGWRIRIERGDELRIVAEREGAERILETSGQCLGHAAVALFLEASAIADESTQRNRARRHGRRAAA